MEILVQEVNGNKVTFTSDFGECRGTWTDEEPEPGRRYTADISIPNKLNMNHLHESEEKHCRLEYDENQETVHLIGQLEDYEEDGFAVLRLEDNIICFETNFDERIELLHGKFIELFVPHIQLNLVGM